MNQAIDSQSPHHLIIINPRLQSKDQRHTTRTAYIKGLLSLAITIQQYVELSRLLHTIQYMTQTHTTTSEKLPSQPKLKQPTGERLFRAAQSNNKRHGKRRAKKKQPASPAPSHDLLIYFLTRILRHGAARLLFSICHFALGINTFISGYFLTTDNKRERVVIVENLPFIVLFWFSTSFLFLRIQ